MKTAELRDIASTEAALNLTHEQRMKIVEAADTIERLTKERDEFNTETLRVIDRNLKLMAEKASMAAERDAARAEVERLKAELSARSEDE